MRLERIASKKEFKNKIRMIKELKRQSYAIFSQSATGNPEENIKKMQELQALLKSKVVDDLYLETKKLTNKKIKRNELRQIYDYGIATIIEEPETEMKNILEKNYCVRCGKCCIETTNIEITPDEYDHMIKNKPELAEDIIESKAGLYQFKKDLPCKFFNSDSKNCEIYNLRPATCQNYPCNNGKIVFAGDCEYMVKYMSEKCENLLKKCI